MEPGYLAGTREHLKRKQVCRPGANDTAGAPAQSAFEDTMLNADAALHLLSLFLDSGNVLPNQS
jgi:hypothetical protein